MITDKPYRRVRMSRWADRSRSRSRSHSPYPLNRNNRRCNSPIRDIYSKSSHSNHSTSSHILECVVCWNVINSTDNNDSKKNGKEKIKNKDVDNQRVNLDGVCNCICCNTCFTNWIKTSSINDIIDYTNLVDDTTCPGCRKKIPHDILCKLVDKDILEYRDRILLQRCLRSMPDVRFCPHAGCENAVFVDDVTSCTKSQCNACSTLFCFQCRDEWHEGMSCIEAQRQKRRINKIGERSFVDFQARYRTHQCPRCNVTILKNGGCSHMTCSSCGHEFCWYCKADYDYDTGHDCEAMQEEDYIDTTDYYMHHRHHHLDFERERDYNRYRGSRYRRERDDYYYYYERDRDRYYRNRDRDRYYYRNRDRDRNYYQYRNRERERDRDRDRDRDRYREDYIYPQYSHNREQRSPYYHHYNRRKTTRRTVRRRGRYRSRSILS